MKNRWKFLKYIIFSCALSAAAVVSATGCGKFEDIAYEEAEVSSLDISVTKETAPAMEEVDQTVYVTGSNVNVRQEPGAFGTVITLSLIHI